MSFVAIIVGLSGDEFYLARQGETTEAKKAQRFRSPQTAEGAAQGHINAQKPVVARHMAFRVEPRA